MEGPGREEKGQGAKRIGRALTNEERIWRGGKI